MRLARLVSVVAAFVLVGGAGCSQGPNAETTSTTSMPEAPADVTGLLERLDCVREPDEGIALEPGELTPRETIQCRRGEDQLAVRLYGSRAEVDAAVRAVDAYCGYRVVGARWMVVVDTPESAAAAQSRVGGRVVELSGCRN